MTVTETVTAPGLSTIYETVYSASGVAESGWQAVELDSHGNASFSVNLAQSGDYVKAVDSLSTPTVTATSSAVTITDPAPAPTIALADLGTAQEPAPGAGVTVTEANAKAFGTDNTYAQATSLSQSHQVTNSAAVSEQESLESLSDQPAINHDRFNLSAAQASTTYEKSTTVAYSLTGKELNGALAEMLLNHLSKLGIETDTVSSSHPDNNLINDHLATLSNEESVHSASTTHADTAVWSNASGQHVTLHEIEAHQIDLHTNHFG